MIMTISDYEVDECRAGWLSGRREHTFLGLERLVPLMYTMIEL